MRSTRQRMRRLLAAVVAVQLVAGPALAQTEVWDPWEGFNRKAYAISRQVDRFGLGPIAMLFANTPKPIRYGIRNLVRNLGEPAVFVNDVLQGRPRTAAKTAGRFAMNSTVGVLGVFDVAKRAGIPHHNNDLGMTLGRWGAQPGPFIYLPIFGPSNLRDGVGTIGGFALNPLDYVKYDGRRAVGLTTNVLGGLNTRAEAQTAIEAIEASSTDPYATLRSYFMQNREAEIRGETELEQLPEIETEPTAPDTSASPAPTPEAQPEPEPLPLPPEEPAAPSPQPRSVSPSGTSN